MKPLVYFLSVFLVLSSCVNDNDPGVDASTFRLNRSGHKPVTVRTMLEVPGTFDGNDIAESENAWIGFTISVPFKNPENPAITEAMHFHWSKEVPKNEVSFTQGGIPVFNDPSRFQEYLPRTNLFNDASSDFSSYLLEDVQSFCAAGTDPDFQNSFRIVLSRHYVDPDGTDAVEIVVEFTIRYVPLCQKGTVATLSGVLKAKLLIPS